MNVEIGERNLETCREVQAILIHREGVKMVAKKLCNVQLSIVEHVKQRTWFLKKVWALSRSVIFDGAEILNC